MERVSWAKVGGNSPYYLNRYRVESPFRYPLHDHQDHWEFVYVSSGSFRHDLGGLRFDHGEGLLVLVRDGDAHALRGEHFSYVNLAFQPAWIDRLQSFVGKLDLRLRLETQERPPSALIPEGQRQRLEEEFDELLRTNATEEGSLSFARVLTSLVIRLLPGLTPAVTGSHNPSDRRSAPPAWLEELVAWARGSKAVPHPGAFCAKSGYAREHVIRAMNRAYGQSPRDFLDGLRLERAKDLLRFTNYPIARVALESGWESLRQFQRTFSRHYRLSPSTFRKERARLAH